MDSENKAKKFIVKRRGARGRGGHRSRVGKRGGADLLRELMTSGTDFGAREAEALDALPLTREGGELLLRYIDMYDGSVQAHDKLFFDFSQILDSDTVDSALERAAAIFEAAIVANWKAMI